MSRDYLAHWVIGIISALVWFWGDRAGIPAAAVSLAATIVPALLGHAIAYTPASPADPVSPPATPTVLPAVNQP